MTELSPRARDLFARARASTVPTPTQRASLLDRIEQSVKPSVAPPPAPPSVALPAIAVSGLVVLATMLSMMSAPRPPHPTVRVVDPPIVAEPTPSIQSAPPTTTLVVEATPTHVEAVATAHRVVEDDMTAELSLLRRAQAARRAHHYAAALAALREHQSRFPNGTLASERDVARALVLCESGRREEGRAFAASFARTAWSDSLAEACSDSVETP